MVVSESLSEKYASTGTVLVTATLGVIAQSSVRWSTALSQAAI